MNGRRALGRVLLAALVLSAAPLQAQISGPSYEVQRGDTLFGIARKAQHDGITRNQMMLAIWRANQGAFPGGNINMLEVGTVLVIPARDVVAAIDSGEADRQVRELLAAKPAAVPPVAAIRPAPAVKAPAKPAPGQEEAARRYREGLAMEHRGDHQGALKAFLEAGEAGYGPAQRRLGEIYDSGSPAVKHDYQASLKWYQKAREQGIEIPKPIQRGPLH
jgi:FimV-like protein